MRNIYRFIWIVSILGTISGILITYTEINDVVYMAFGYGLESVTRDQYFYLSFALLIINNILWYVIGRLLVGIPPKMLAIPNKNYWLGNKYRYRKVKEILGNWMLVLAVVTNYWLMVYFLGLKKPNSSDPEYTLLPSYYAWLGYLFTLSTVSPFFRFFYQKLSIMFDVEDE